MRSFRAGSPAGMAASTFSNENGSDRGDVLFDERQIGIDAHLDKVRAERTRRRHLGMKLNS